MAFKRQTIPQRPVHWVRNPLQWPQHILVYKENFFVVVVNAIKSPKGGKCKTFLWILWMSTKPDLLHSVHLSLLLGQILPGVGSWPGWDPSCSCFPGWSHRACPQGYPARQCRGPAPPSLSNCVFPQGRHPPTLEKSPAQMPKPQRFARVPLGAPGWGGFCGFQR